MTGLLDTHSFLWAVVSPEKLSAKIRHLIADRADEIHVSTVTFWEISLKFSLGKLQLEGLSPEDLVSIAIRMGLTISAPTAEESAGFHRLPKGAHKDPFDRMLIWQCLGRGWIFLTRDRSLAAYSEQGLVAVW